MQIRREYSSPTLSLPNSQGSYQESRYAGESVFLVPYLVENLGLYLVN